MSTVRATRRRRGALFHVRLITLSKNFSAEDMTTSSPLDLRAGVGGEDVRARATLSAERVAAASGTSEWVHREAYVPRYNAQPGAALPCVRASDPTRGEPPDERRVESMTWGLVPSFTGAGEKPDHFRMFNARGETLREKPAFGRLLRRRRCVALIDGFYEWRREGAGKRAGAKQPYYLYLRGSRDENESAYVGEHHESAEIPETADAETNVSRRWDDATRVRPIRVAALYDVWRRKRADADARDAFFDTNTDTETMTTCVLVTVDASERIAVFRPHARGAPVGRRGEGVARGRPAYGDGDGDSSEDRRPETLLRPYAAEDLAWHPVTLDVNAAGKLEGPRCCAPARRAAARDAGSVAGLFAKAAAFEKEKKNEHTPEKRRDRSSPFRAAESSPSSAFRKRPRTTPPRPANQRSVADMFKKK